MCCGAGIVTEEQRYAIAADTPCNAISVDLLQTYKNPIDCYIKYGLWDSINSSKLELENASDYLQTFINQKIENPDNCTGIESLTFIRTITGRIIEKGVCL